MNNGWLAIINILCLIAVIHTHLMAETVHPIVHNVLRMVIPLFSLIAGYSWGNFLKRTKGLGAMEGIKLFVLPYFFWLTCYFVLNSVVLDVVIRRGSFTIPSLSQIVSGVMFGGFAVHTWFLIVLIYCLIISTKMYQKIAKKKLYYSIMLFIGVVALAVSSIYANDSSGFLHFAACYACWLIPNFCLGVCIGSLKKDFFCRPVIRKYVIPCCVTFGLIAILSIEIRGGETLLVLGIFMGAMAWPYNSAPKWILGTSQYGMGIYLTHLLFTSVVNEGLKLIHVSALSDACAWIVSVVIFILAYYLVMILRKMPYMGNFV